MKHLFCQSQIIWADHYHIALQANAPFREQRLTWEKEEDKIKGQHQPGHHPMPDEFLKELTNSEKDPDAPTPREVKFGLTERFRGVILTPEEIMEEMAGKTPEQQQKYLREKENQDLLRACLAASSSALEHATRFKGLLDNIESSPTQISRQILGLIETVATVKEEPNEDAKNRFAEQYAEGMAEMSEKKEGGLFNGLIKFMATMHEKKALKSLGKFMDRIMTVTGGDLSVNPTMLSGDSPSERQFALNQLTQMAEKLVMREADKPEREADFNALKDLRDAISYFQLSFILDGSFHSYLLNFSAIQGHLACVYAEINGYDLSDELKNETDNTIFFNKKVDVLENFEETDADTCNTNGGIAWKASAKGINNLKERLQKTGARQSEENADGKNELSLLYLSQELDDESSAINAATRNNTGLRYECTMATIREVKKLYKQKAAGGEKPSPSYLHTFIQYALRNAVNRSRKGEEIVQEEPTVKDEDITNPLHDVEELKAKFQPENRGRQKPTYNEFTELQFLVEWITNLGGDAGISEEEMRQYETSVERSTDELRQAEENANEQLGALGNVAILHDAAMESEKAGTEEAFQKAIPEKLLDWFQLCEEDYALLIYRVIEKHNDKELIKYLRHRCTLQQLDLTAKIIGFEDAYSWIKSEHFPENAQDLDTILQKAKEDEQARKKDSSESQTASALSPTPEAETIGTIVKRTQGEQIDIKETHQATASVPVEREARNELQNTQHFSDTVTGELQVGALKQYDNNLARTVYGMELSNAKTRILLALEARIQREASEKLDVLAEKAPQNNPDTGEPNAMPVRTQSSYETLKRLKRFRVRDHRHPVSGITQALNQLASPGFNEELKNPVGEDVDVTNDHMAIADDTNENIQNSPDCPSGGKEFLGKLKGDQPSSTTTHAHLQQLDRRVIVPTGWGVVTASEEREAELTEQVKSEGEISLEQEVTETKQRLSAVQSRLEAKLQQFENQELDLLSLDKFCRGNGSHITQLRQQLSAAQGLLQQHNHKKAVSQLAAIQTDLNSSLEPLADRLEKITVVPLPADKFKVEASHHFATSDRVSIYAFYDDTSNTIYINEDIKDDGMKATIETEEWQHAINTAIHGLDNSWWKRVDASIAAKFGSQYDQFKREVLPQKKGLEGVKRDRMGANELLAQITAYKQAKKYGRNTHFHAERQAFFEEVMASNIDPTEDMSPLQCKYDSQLKVSRKQEYAESDSLGIAAASAVAEPPNASDVETVPANDGGLLGTDEGGGSEDGGRDSGGGRGRSGGNEEGRDVYDSGGVSGGEEPEEAASPPEGTKLYAEKIRDIGKVLYNMNVFFQAYPDQRTDESQQTLNNMQSDYEYVQEWFKKTGSEKEEPFQQFVENLSKASIDIKNEIDKFDANALDLRNAKERTGLFQHLRDNVTLVNVFDVIQMFKDIGEDIKRQHKRRQEQKIGKAGQSLTSWIPKSVIYVGKLADEFYKREQQAELDEVEQWKKALENLDNYELQKMLHHPANPDQMKAIIYLLTEHGRMFWDDPDLWRSFSRFSHYQIPIDLCQRNESLREEWLRKCCTDIWKDKDIYRQWKSTNDGNIKSERDKYKGEVDRLSNIGGMQGELAKQLKMFVQAKEKGIPIGDNVNPHLYEAIIDYAIGNGKMSMEDKFFYLIQGVAEGIISADRLRRLAGEEGGYLNVFPFIDYFYQRNNSLPEIRALAKRLLQITNEDDPKRYIPGLKTTLWLELEVARESSVQDRLGKGMDKKGAEMDHDDQHFFMPRLDWNEINNAAMPSSGGQQKFSGDAWQNAYTGFNSFFKSLGYLAEMDENNVKGAKFSGQDVRQVVKGITTYVVMDSILTRRSDLGNAQRPRIGFGEMRMGTSIVGHSTKHTIYEDRQKMQVLSREIIEAYAPTMGIANHRQFIEDIFYDMEGGQAPNKTQQERIDSNLKILEEKLHIAVKKQGSDALKNILQKHAPELNGHRKFDYNDVKEVWESKMAHDKEFHRGEIQWKEKHSAYANIG